VSETDQDAAFDAMLAELTPSMHRDRFAPAGTGLVPVSRSGQPTIQGRRRLPWMAAGLVAVAAVVAVGFGVYQSGAAPVAAVPSASPAASAGLDQARVAQLMGQIQSNPKDTAALLELGDAFFTAGDFTTAQTWLEKLVALEPNNTQGLLALGAAQFNLGDSDAAKANWQAVLKLDSENVEAHYDLGFLYLNQAPPDLDGVRREWSEVARLAPGTNLATVVQQHLDALAASSGAPTSGPSAAASAAPTPAPTVAPSTAPTVAPTGSTAP